MSAPSGYTALDFVGFTDKGTYSPSATYMRNDLVHYGGNIMRCLIDNTTNVTPVVGANWELWVGASANLVERVIAPLENNPADVAYGVGRQIIYDDWLWEVIAPIAVGDALVDYAVDPINANIKKSAPVETQLLAVKAEADATDNMIAPTEANASSSSAAYAVGDQLILNNVLYTVTTAITIGDALVSGTGGNIEASDNLIDQLATKADDSALATVAKTGAYSDLSGNPTLGTAAAKNSTNAVTQNSTDLVESGAVYSAVDTLNTALTTKADSTEVNAINNFYGAKNLLPTYVREETISGEITVTSEDDGTIIVNGTATSNRVIFLVPSHSWSSTSIGWTKELAGAQCQLLDSDYTNFPSDMSWNYTLQFSDSASNILASAISNKGVPSSITIPSSGIHSYAAYLYLGAGTYNNCKFRPLLRLKSVKDNTYAPYALTNRQLTPKVIAGDESNASAGQFWEVIQLGNMITVIFSAFNVSLTNYPNAIITTGLPKPKTGGPVYGLGFGLDTEYRIAVLADGTLQIKNKTAGAVTSNPGYITGQLTYLI